MGYWNQAKGGFRLAAIVLVAGGWLFLVFGGTAVAFSPTPYPPLLGWGLLTLAGAILMLTMERWIKALPGLLAYGVLNGLLATATGHLASNSSEPISRGAAVAMTLLLVACTGIAMTLISRKLTVIDRISVLGVFASFVFGFAGNNRSLVGFGLMLCCLTVAWGADHILNRRRRSG